MAEIARLLLDHTDQTGACVLLGPDDPMTVSGGVAASIGSLLLHRTTGAAFTKVGVAASAWARLARATEFNVLDYAPVGVTINDGVGNATSAFQAAYNAAKVAGGKVRMPAGSYLLNDDLDLTRSGGPSTVAIIFEGDGPRATQINAQNTGGHVFDCTGSSLMTFRNFSVNGNTTFTPATAFFLARNNSGGGSPPSAGNHIFENVHTLGNFSVAPVYGYASEILHWSNCEFTNSVTGKRVVVLTQTNIFAQTSKYVTVATGAISTTTFRFDNCDLNNYAAAGNNDCLYLDGVSGLSFDGFMHTTAGRAFVYIDASVKASTNIAIRDTMWDGGNTTYGVTAAGAFGASRLTLDNIYDTGVKAFAGTVTAPTGGITVYGQDLCILSNVRIANVYSTSAAYYRFYEVDYSHLDFGAADKVYIKNALSGNRITVDATKLTMDRRDLATGNAVYDLVSGTIFNPRESLNNGDADRTGASALIASSAPTQRWESTLTANRTVTLPSNATSTIGQRFRIVRTGLGAFTLTVQDATPTALKVMPAATAAWAEVEFDGSWRLVGYAPL